MRLRGQVYNQLIEAASRHDRPLGNEVEMRIEESFRLEERLERLERLLADIARKLDENTCKTSAVKHL